MDEMILDNADTQSVTDSTEQPAVVSKPKTRGLGRGLNALFEDDEDSDFDAVLPGRSKTGANSVSVNHDEITGASKGRVNLPIEKLEPSAAQPRNMFHNESLDELAESIKTHGLLQPILVRQIDGRDAYEIIAGERRWRASQRAQLHDVPVIIKVLDDLQALEIALIENLQREDLNPVDEAMGYQKLMTEHNYTQEQLGNALGKSRSHIANMTRMLNLPDGVLFYLEQGMISSGHARALITAKDPLKLIKTILDQGLNVRQTEKLVAAESGSSKPAKAEKEPREKDVDTVYLEDELSKAIGLKVLIDSKNGKSGKVTIEFKDLDQLDSLLKVLG